MGSRLSWRLLEAGFELTVWNRTPGKAADLVRRGAREARSPREAAAGAEAILTMLGDPASVLQTVLGPHGVIEGMSAGSVLIDLTTVDPITPITIHEAVSKKGAAFLESPVTGSKPAAEKGELVLMIGGDIDTLNRVRPVLEPLSKKIVHMGPVGSGARMKLVNNLIIAGAMQALFEGMTLGKAGGLNPETMLEVLNSSALASPLLRMKGTAVIHRDFDPNFSTKHMAKDLYLAVEEAHRRGIALPQLAVISSLYEAALAQGLGEEDFAALLKVTEKLSGIGIAG
jgi:3-hydroxyisobutyrate dehydrogenase-like beta-hydroxyacid dehydrogenase